VVCCTPEEKQGIFDSLPIILTRSIILSADLRRAFNLLVVERIILSAIYLERLVYKGLCSHRSQKN
jgi:hypothetical protein